MGEAAADRFLKDLKKARDYNTITPGKGKDFARVSWPDGYLSRCDFTGSSFTEANLRGCSFEKCNLRDVDFTDANLRNAYFAGADLRGAKLAKATIRSADFTDALLDGCTFDNGTSISKPPLTVTGFRWPVVITDEIMVIGDWRNTIDGWEVDARGEMIGEGDQASFDDSPIGMMNASVPRWWKNDQAWWQEHKPLLMAIARMHQGRRKPF